MVLGKKLFFDIHSAVKRTIWGNVVHFQSEIARREQLSAKGVKVPSVKFYNPQNQLIDEELIRVLQSNVSLKECVPTMLNYWVHEHSSYSIDDYITIRNSNDLLKYGFSIAIQNGYRKAKDYLLKPSLIII